MPALVEKDKRLIWHCCASKYKIGLVVGMRVPLYKVNLEASASLPFWNRLAPVREDKSRAFPLYREIRSGIAGGGIAVGAAGGAAAADARA